MSIKSVFDVLVAGELNVDLILNDLQQAPEVGKEIIAEQMTLSLGSSAAIFASNLQTIGMQVAFTGKLGKDLYGDFILNALGIQGVDTRFVDQQKQWQTGASIALNLAEDRAMVTFPGAMRYLKATDISDHMLSAAKHLHVSSAFLQPALKPGLTALFKRAKAAGLTTSFDPQWDPAEKWDLNLEELLPHIDVFLPNAAELCAFTETEQIHDALARLQHLPAIIAVKTGSSGAILAHRQQRISQPAFLHKEVVDCIGAGDSFNAGFIHHFLSGNTLEECLAFGNLMGAINTLGAGGTGAFPSKDQVKKLAYEHFNHTI